MKTYASFFEWHDRGQKELGVVEELVVALNRSANLGLQAPREFSPDPPDCVCLNAAGEPIAIEVAEVVCEQAARLNAQGSSVFRHWRPGELAAHVSRELADKDSKIFHGGPYRSVIACLFTDEPALTVEQAESWLAPHEVRTVLAAHRCLPVVLIPGGYEVISCGRAKASRMTPNPSLPPTCYSGLRPLPPAGELKR